MLARKNQEEVVDASTIERAMQLHDSLVNYGVCARDVPAAIVRAQAWFHQGLNYEQEHFEPKVMSEPYDNHEEIHTMKVLLNKLRNYKLDEEDILALQPLGFAEAEHMRKYLQFSAESLTYTMFIRDYLLRLKAEMSVKVQGSGVNAVWVKPAFYKHGEAPNAVKRLLHMLNNVEREHVPLKLFKMYSSVFAEFEAIDPSKTKSKAGAEFYERHLGQLKAFSFVPPVLAEREEKVSSLTVSM